MGVTRVVGSRPLDGQGPPTLEGVRVDDPPLFFFRSPVSVSDLPGVPPLSREPLRDLEQQYVPLVTLQDVQDLP